MDIGPGKRSVIIFRRRTSERGAAVFVVMMAILVLTGVGVWAIRSASLADLASGNARAGAQTLYLSEMATLAAASYMSLPGGADSLVSPARDDEAEGAAETDDCQSVPDGEFCKSVTMGDLDVTIMERTAAMASGTPFSLLDQTGSEGSLGPDPNLLEAELLFELTDLREVQIQGVDVKNKGTYKRATLTSFGFTRPLPSGGGRVDVSQLCTQPSSTAQNSMATQLGMRAHMVIGPLTLN